MTLAAILEIIQGVLKFPDAILRLVRVLKATPEEQHQKLVSQIEAEAKQLEETGRPTWEG